MASDVGSSNGVIKQAPQSLDEKQIVTDKTPEVQENVAEASGEGISFQMEAHKTSDAQENSSQKGEEEESNGVPSPEDLKTKSEELLTLGKAKLRDDDFDGAIQLLGKALEYRVQLYGEFAAECAPAYYQYGYALLLKAQLDSEVLGDKATEAADVASAVQKGDASKALGEDTEESERAKGKEGEGEKGEEEEEEGGEGEGERDLGEEETGEEEEGDMELAWKLLEIARVIYTREGKRCLEEASVVEALADISLEKEDFSTCFHDYSNALSILSGLVERDNRRIISLHFKICMAHELNKSFSSASVHCQKAISLTENKIERLTKSLENTGEAEGSTDTRPGEGMKKYEDLKAELEDLRLLIQDLKGKEEDLSSALASHSLSASPSLLDQLKSQNPILVSGLKDIVSSVMGRFSAPSSSSGLEQETDRKGKAAAVSDPQPSLLSPSGGGSIPSSTSSASGSSAPAPETHILSFAGVGSVASSSASSASVAPAAVIHLGVVGRGKKRANPIPISKPSSVPSSDVGLSFQDHKSARIE